MRQDVEMHLCLANKPHVCKVLHCTQIASTWQLQKKGKNISMHKTCQQHRNCAELPLYRQY